MQGVNSLNDVQRCLLDIVFKIPVDLTRQNSITFLGEELTTVFSCSDDFAWDFPQQLHNQSDMVWPPYTHGHTPQDTHTETKTKHAHRHQ